MTTKPAIRRSETEALLAGKKASRWRVVAAGDQRLYNVGIDADGTLWNPNHYPEALVRAAIAAAEENKAQRRRDAAKRAVATRARRYEERIQQIADVIRTGKGIGNTTHCVVCKKALTDTVSQERGIGPECWDRIPQTIEQRRQG